MRFQIISCCDRNVLLQQVDIMLAILLKSFQLTMESPGMQISQTSQVGRAAEGAQKALLSMHAYTLDNCMAGRSFCILCIDCWGDSGQGG